MLQARPARPTRRRQPARLSPAAPVADPCVRSSARCDGLAGLRGRECGWPVKPPKYSSDEHSDNLRKPRYASKKTRSWGFGRHCGLEPVSRIYFRTAPYRNFPTRAWSAPAGSTHRFLVDALPVSPPAPACMPGLFCAPQLAIVRSLPEHAHATSVALPSPRAAAHVGAQRSMAPRLHGNSPDSNNEGHLLARSCTWMAVQINVPGRLLGHVASSAMNTGHPFTGSHICESPRLIFSLLLHSALSNVRSADE